MLEWKDWLLLVMGFAFGIPASMTAALILGPAMTILCGFNVIRFFAKLRQMVCSDKIYDVEWKQNWHVQSENFPASNPSYLKIYRIWHLLAAEAEQRSSSGKVYKFRIVAVINRGFITGKWMDPQEDGYYGVFQLSLSHTHDYAVGLWAGFSSSKTIKAGDWIWTSASDSKSII